VRCTHIRGLLPRHGLYAFAQWKATRAKIVSEPEDKPWKLREFMAADLDGNLIRVFDDFRGDM